MLSICPTCHGETTGEKSWIQIDSAGQPDSNQAPIQTMLGDMSNSSAKFDGTGANRENMVTLYPCEHSFPADKLTIVEKKRQELIDLTRTLEAASDPVEIQLLREQTHLARKEIDSAVKVINHRDGF
jgi:hypothetical protein